MNNNIITFWIATRITTEKRREYLYECINSILLQSNNNFRIIISDDNSNIPVDWNKYKNNDKIEIFHQEKSLWIFKNFNFCLEKTNSKWFIPMWDDDLIDKNFVKIILDVYKNNSDIEIIYFNHENINWKGIIFNKTKTLLKEWYHSYNKSSNYEYSKLLWSSPSSFFSVVNTEKIKSFWGFPDYWMTTDWYIAFLYFLNFKWYFKNTYIAKLRRHSENASWYNDVILFMDERVHLINIIIKDFWNEFKWDLIDFLNKQKVEIKYSHIKLMKVFRDLWRFKWIIFFKECFSNKKVHIKTIIILIIWLILWKNIQKGFNFVSIIYEYIQSKIKSFIINN